MVNRRRRNNVQIVFQLLLIVFFKLGLSFPFQRHMQIILQRREYSHIIMNLRESSSSFTINDDADSHDNGSSGEESFRLGYVTDVEGNLEYFKEYVSRSNVLDFEDDHGDKKLEDDTVDPHAINLTIRDGCYFVFGGDAVDKGPGDIRICRALVDLKQKFPDKVYLLVGNRDLNKVRFTAELSESDMRRPIDDIPPPHWDPKAPSLREFLETMIEKPNNDTSSSSSSQTIEEINNRVNRLKYMLQHTLGCPKTFEFRREELSILNDVPLKCVTDDHVLKSMIHEVESPTGSLRQYLEHANVVVKLGNTIFCHGAIDANTMKYVPMFDTKFENPRSKPSPKQICSSLMEWVNSLNDYLKHGLLDYKERPYWNQDRDSRGGESLMALQNRPAMWGRSIVSNCYGDGGCITSQNAAMIRNDPQRITQAAKDPLVFEKVSSDPMDKRVADWLLEHDVQRVMVGHKPTGDCPAVLSAGYTGVEIVSADTSFSDIKADDNRGKAIAIVEIVGSCINDNHLEISGRLRDGNSFLSIFPRLCPSIGIDERTGDPLLGRQLEDRWWVKAATGAHYQLCRGEGRNVEYRLVPHSSINDSRVKVQFSTPLLNTT